MYYISPGPDICGPGTKKVHVIFNYKGKNLLTKKDIRCKVRLQSLNIFMFVKDYLYLYYLVSVQITNQVGLKLLQDDVYTHLYTLIVKSDNTYEVRIDNEKVESGDLESDWDFLPPKKIKVTCLFR